MRRLAARPTVSSEAYVVTGGTGQVHTISMSGAEEHDLTAGSLLWFSPGTVHRLVNTDGLTLTVIMSNAGLPEAGDAVLTFPRRILADPDQYALHAILPRGLSTRPEWKRQRVPGLTWHWKDTPNCICR